MAARRDGTMLAPRSQPSVALWVTHATSAAARWVRSRADVWLAMGRPGDYDELPVDKQRVADSTLWASATMVLTTTTLSCVFAAFWSGVGISVAFSSGLLAVAAFVLVHRGRTTAAVAALTIAMLGALDVFLLLSGGRESTTALWYVIAPSVILVLIPAQFRVRVVLLLLAHQVGLCFALYGGDWLNVLGLSPKALRILDYMLSVPFAGAFGFCVALARQQMVERLARAQRDVRLAMTHIMSGFFVMDRDGRMVVDTSDALQRWLGGGRKGDDVYECLRRRHPELAERFRTGFETLVAEDLPLELCLDQLPTSLTIGPRDYELTYSLWTERGSERWSRVILILRDVTRERRSEEATLNRQALAVFVRGLQRSRPMVEEYMETASALVTNLLNQPESEEWNTWLESLGRIAQVNNLSGFSPHHQEAMRLAIGGARPAAAQIVARAWDQVRTVFDSLHDQHEDETVRASPSQYERLQALIRQRADRSAIIDEIHSWAVESTAVAIGGPASNRAV